MQYIELKRIYQRRDENVDGKNNEIHWQTHTQEIAELVTAGHVNQHVGGRTDGRGET